MSDPDPPIEVALDVDPPELTLAERGRFRISLSATNEGSETVDPELHLAQLLVNGTPSKAWSLAVGNGKRERKWFELPPGETTSMTWSTLGESLFREPGTFELVLRLRDRERAAATVRVHPG